jgi:putative sigma-54 modulation protein
MEIIVTGKQLDVTDAIRDYAESKVGKLPRYFDRVQSIEVLVDKAQRQQYEVQMIVHVEHHDPFVAHDRHDDLYACIDVVCDKMERQLTDYKQRLRNRKHPSSF